MKNKKQIEFLYKEDGIRNAAFLDTLLHDDFILEWDSSEGNLFLKKSAIINLANELKQNYEDSFMEISHFIEENNQIVVKYNHKVTTIENPKEFFLIAKVVAIWEFEGDKIKKGYQISKPN
ncbi:nuclear transport factor 2 family protein [Flavobacterium sp.]|uniref:nuclear transport factor 2 family protein n=1 Tax=Flavobacterium sp. TaxID=239 RepID=UPI00404845B3